MAACLGCCDILTIGCWERFFAPKARELSEVEAQLKTGDLLIACANPTGRIAGQYAVTSSPWDHVGMIWMHEGVAYVIDSGSSRYYRDICRRPLHFGDGPAPPGSSWSLDGDGPQMYSLRALIDEQGRRPLEVAPGKTPWYYSRLGVRPLARPLTEGELRRLRMSVETLRDRPYQRSDDEESAAEMTNSAIDICDCCGATANTRERRDSLFCSELVAAFYIDTGLLPKSPPSCEYAPSEFSAFHGCNLAALCGCCCAVYALAACGVGDMRRAARSDGGTGPLFSAEIVLKTPHPPASSCSPPPAIVMPR